MISQRTLDFFFLRFYAEKRFWLLKQNQGILSIFGCRWASSIHRIPVWLWTTYTKCQKPKGLHNAGKRLWMNVIHTSRLQKSVDLRGILHSFSSVLHEWLKMGHKSFPTRQLFPVAFLSACLMGPGAQQGLLPINNTASTGREHRIFHQRVCIPAAEAASKIQAAKSKPTIFQGLVPYL